MGTDTVLCKDCSEYWECHQVTTFAVKCPWFKPKPDTYLNGFVCNQGCP